MRGGMTAGCASALLLIATAAGAQPAWPSKPVQLILENAAGSVVDIAGRVYADHMTRAMKNPWLIQNRPGADGVIAAEAVARSAPDGYTVFFATAATLAINPHTRKSMPFDPERDFTSVAVIVDSPEGFVIAAHASMPFNTLPEMIAHAKSNPGKLTYSATVPIFSMFGEWFRRRAGVDLVEVPYKATAQAVQDSVAGVVSLGLYAYPTIQGFVKAGKLKVLAAAPDNRLRALPDVPAVGESYPGFAHSWVVLVGPAGLPREVVQRMNRDTAAVVKDPQFGQDLSKIRWFNQNGARTPEETAAFIRKEREHWGQVIREIGRERH